MSALIRSARARAPAKMRSRQKQLAPDEIEAFKAFIKAAYFHPPQHWETPSGRSDLHGLAIGRLEDFRDTQIPWLNSIRPLAGLKVLEVGCGTGAGLVSLAEQGAEVTGIDLERAALTVARRQCELYGVEATLIEANAAEAGDRLDIGAFDLVIFFAVLEHMTHAERLECLETYWARMKPGALLAVLDTPNRLWVFDSHTSDLPFFHWLPEPIAIRYCRESARPEIAALHRDTSEDGMLALQRWGRGISYHEFDLAIGDVRKTPVLASLAQWRRRTDPVQFLKWLVATRSFQNALRAQARDVPAPWFEPYLDLVLMRPHT